MSEHPNLAAALVAALADLSVVDKGRKAKIETKGGGSYEYEYADLGDVVKLTRPVLAEHGIVVLTPIEEHGNGLKCTVVLLHSSGERMDFGPFPFPHGATAQATGSMVTYYRRYALVAALGMAAGDDDDGAQAHPARQEHREPDEAPCGLCGEIIPGARSDKEPMRAHRVEVHGWERRADGTVAPPEVVPASRTGQPAQAGGVDDTAHMGEPTSPAVIDPAIRDRLLARLDALPSELRHAVEDACVAACDGRFPNELTPADVPVVGELIEDGANSVKPGAALVARAAKHAKSAA